MKITHLCRVCLCSAFLLMLMGAAVQISTQAQTTPLVVINEIAWSGTPASASDEWIELRNNSNVQINLTGWTLAWGDEETERVIHFTEDQEETNTLELKSNVIRPQGFYLLERTDDEAVRDVVADLIYSGSLRNSGEALELRNADGEVISTANIEGGEWPAGTTQGDISYASMERINSELQDDEANWASNNGVRRNGRDADGNLINGTPKAENSRSN